MFITETAQSSNIHIVKTSFLRKATHVAEDLFKFYETFFFCNFDLEHLEWPWTYTKTIYEFLIIVDFINAGNALIS